MVAKPKRKEIRDIAARLFVEKGFENTTTRDIAREGGISASAIYYYFDSKEELLFQILEETIGIGLTMIEEILKSDKSLRGKLSSIIAIHTEFYTIDPYKMYLMVHDHKCLTPEHNAIFDQKKRSYMELVRKLLEELKEKGEIVDMDATVCAFAFFGMVSWAYRWYDPKGRIKPPQLAEIFHRIFTRGIYTNP